MSGARAAQDLCSGVQSEENYTTATDKTFWLSTIFYLNFLDGKLNVMTLGESVNQVLS